MRRVCRVIDLDETDEIFQLSSVLRKAEIVLRVTAGKDHGYYSYAKPTVKITFLASSRPAHAEAQEKKRKSAKYWPRWWLVSILDKLFRGSFEDGSKESVTHMAELLFVDIERFIYSFVLQSQRCCLIFSLVLTIRSKNAVAHCANLSKIALVVYAPAWLNLEGGEANGYR